MCMCVDYSLGIVLSKFSLQESNVEGRRVLSYYLLTVNVCMFLSLMVQYVDYRRRLH